MENMVKRILEIDKQMRSLSVDTDSCRAQTEKEIADEIARIKDEYNDKLDAQRLKIKKIESEAADKKLAERKADAEKELAEMRSKADSNMSKWVDEIFNRTLA